MKLDKTIIKQFIDFVIAELGIKSPPRIILTTNKAGIKTTAIYRKRIEIKVYVKDRHLVDVLRSLAHELVHHWQLEIGKYGDEGVQDIGGEIEDEANAIAGQLIKKFAYNGNMRIYEIHKKSAEVLSEARLKKQFKPNFRFFDIHVCYVEDEQGCWSGCSLFIAIPENIPEFDVSIGEIFDFQDVPEIINYATKVIKELNEDDIKYIDYVREIDENEYCYENPKFCEEGKLIHEARLKKQIKKVNPLALPLAEFLEISPYELKEIDNYYYGLTQFETPDGEVYAIGTDEEADNAYEEALSYIKDEFKNYVNPSNLSYYIDDDCAKQWADGESDYFYELIRDEPSNWINDDPEQMTDYAQEEIEELQTAITETNSEIVVNETTIEEIETEISELEDKLEEISDQELIEQIQERLEILKKELETLLLENEEKQENVKNWENEIENIKSDKNNPDYWEYSEEQIEAEVKSRVNDIADDLIGYLEEIYGSVDRNGFEEIYSAVENCIDKDKFIEDIKNNGSRGEELSGYNGQENYVHFDGITYYIYRI